jgi:hypothetical protein
MTSALFRTLVPALALVALGATQGCGASSDDGAETLDSNLDFYSDSAREYFVSGTSTVTLEPELATASEDAKLARAKELVPLKNVAISWFLNQYIAEKEHDQANRNYGGFGALTKFSSESDATITKTGALTYSFTYRVEVAGKKELIASIPGTDDGQGGKKFELKMGKVPNTDLAQLEMNSEWYRKAPWDKFDPATVSADRLETIALAIVQQPGSSDAYLPYDKLYADGELTIGVHFGWDYHARYDIQGSRAFYNWLVDSQGFVSPVTGYEKLLRTSGALTKTIRANGRDVRVRLWMYHPGDAAQNVPGPDPDTDAGGRELEADVRESLKSREVIIWAGHSGPLYGFALANWKKTAEGDLDDSEIPTLELPRSYQLVVANGCHTYAFGQAFWDNPAKADHSNVNVITSTSFSNAGTDGSARRVVTALTNQNNGRVAASRVSDLAIALDGAQGGFDTMFGVHGIDANPKGNPLADKTKLCASCTSDTDCGADGNRCSQISTTQRVCTTGCVDDSACGAGYACKSLRNVSEKQCVPTSGTCR